MEKGWSVSGGVGEDDSATGTGVDNLWFRELYVAEVSSSASKCVEVRSAKKNRPPRKASHDSTAKPSKWGELWIDGSPYDQVRDPRS